MRMTSSGERSNPLSEAEKAELRELAQSGSLRRDLRRLRENRRNAPPAFDEFIRFATTMARLGNHPRRPFRRIPEGRMML